MKNPRTTVTTHSKVKNRKVNSNSNNKSNANRNGTCNGPSSRNIVPQQYVNGPSNRNSSRTRTGNIS